MSTNNKFSFRALRVLTYTVLSKAIIDAVILVSMMTDSHVLLTIAHAAEFVCIVAFVMCLGGITALSKKFDTERRIMVIVLILDCITLLLIMFEIRMLISSDSAAGYFESIALVSFAAERLLLGAAFLLLMKGFGEILRNEGDDASATASERLGMIYLCSNSAAAILAAFVVTTGKAPLIAASAVFELAGIILEFLMYRRASGTALLLWRKRAGVTDKWNGLP